VVACFQLTGERVRKVSSRAARANVCANRRSISRNQKMKRILVADDSTATRALIAAALADLQNVRVERVSTGIEALKLLSTIEIDLVLTDIHMPEINGLELVRFIKSDERLRSIPVIVISTEATEDDRRRALALGADDYLPKPFTAQQLQHTINKLMRTGGVGRG
jgi:two-component system, chemotaxis family, chemotaxis protein CheY